MKAKQYLTLGLGIVAGFGISVVGVSYASQNLVTYLELDNIKKLSDTKIISIGDITSKTIEEYGRLALRHLNELQFA